MMLNYVRRQSVWFLNRLDLKQGIHILKTFWSESLIKDMELKNNPRSTPGMATHAVDVNEAM